MPEKFNAFDCMPYKTRPDCALFIYRDIRSIHPVEERVRSFSKRAERYFQNFLNSAATSGLERLPYFHYLRNHLGQLMEFYFDYFEWGYGMFCCNAGEHLNKIIKTSEVHDTNLGANRFLTIVRTIRMKQFIYTKSVIKEGTSIKCSACNDIGHNRKNKSCPMHSSHPPIFFDESEDEG